MGDNNDNDDDYASPPPSLVSLAASSDLEPLIPFGLGGQEALVTSAGYTKLAFSVFTQDFPLVLLGMSSSSFSASTIMDKDMADLGWRNSSWGLMGEA